MNMKFIANSYCMNVKDLSLKKKDNNSQTFSVREKNRTLLKRNKLFDIDLDFFKKCTVCS